RVLGSAHRFVTGVYGRINAGSVGELVLRGEGDPSLETRDVRELAHELRDAGLRKVGSIAVDQSYFDDHYVPPSFDEQPTEWAACRAPVSAISLEENTIRFVVRPGKAGEDAVVSVGPPGFVEVQGHVRSTSKREADAVTLALEPRAGRLVAKVGGHLR